MNILRVKYLRITVPHYALPWTGVWQWEEKGESQPYEGKNKDEYPLHPVVGDVSQWLQFLKLE